MFVPMDENAFKQLEVKPKDEVKKDEKRKIENESRTATATCDISLKKETLIKLLKNEYKDIFQVAKTSAIMASKNTFLNLPMCFQNTISNCDVEFDIDSKNSKIKIYVTCKSIGKMSVEMEALNACSISALSIYQSLKSKDKDLTINNLKILSRTGKNDSEFRFLIDGI